MAESESYGYDQPQDKDNLRFPEVNESPEVFRGPPPPAGSAASNQPGGYAGPGYPAPIAAGYPAPNPYMAHQSQQSTNTTVVLQQPQRQTVIRGPREWSSGVLDCCKDMGICLCGCFCQCCLASQVAQDLDESSCVPCCVPGWLIALRMKMRTQENIPGSLMDDCCTIACCGVCVLCQLAREIRFVKIRDQVALQQIGAYL